MQDIVKDLRDAAIEIASAGINGWGNVMSWGADEIERLRAEVLRLRRLCASDESVAEQDEIERLRAEEVARLIRCMHVQDRVKDIFSSAHTKAILERGAAVLRAQEAETELAELRARIAKAPPVAGEKA